MNQSPTNQPPRPIQGTPSAPPTWTPTCYGAARRRCAVAVGSPGCPRAQPRRIPWGWGGGGGGGGGEGWGLVGYMVVELDNVGGLEGWLGN